MKLELTEEEAQKIISSQRREIGELKGRLMRAYICTNYLNSEHVVRITGKEIDDAIAHMRYLIEQDRPEDPEDYDYVNQYDHDAIGERIKEFEALEKQELYTPERGARVSIFTYPFWFIATGYDDNKTRAQVDMFEKLRTYLWREGERVPPNHFSSHDVWF